MNQRVLLIGWDAADWKVINPLMDAGKMPNVQRLVESGDILLRDGRYFVGRNRFLLISSILFTAKRLLLGRESEFE